jgi:hypothetical protein
MLVQVMMQTIMLVQMMMQAMGDGGVHDKSFSKIIFLALNYKF